MADAADNGMPLAPAGTGYVAIGDAVPRIDGPVKVTGAARYSAEVAAEDLVHGAVVNAAIARGRITTIDDAQARAVPGVIDVLSHLHQPQDMRLRHYFSEDDASPDLPIKPLVKGEVHYSGQPVALVLADTLEVAHYAASLVRIEYQEVAHETDLVANLARSHVPDLDGDSAPPRPRGDADAALAAAEVSIDCEYHVPVEHHNPMEMHATTAIHETGGKLTIHDKNQGSQPTRKRVVQAFGWEEDTLTLLNTWVGGAFGSGLRPQYNLLLAIIAATHLKRAVRVVLTRQQMFTFGHRPEAWQRVRLGADRHGKLQALVHEATAETSRLDDFTEMITRWSGQLYRCDNVRADYRLVKLDLPTPLDMRAPGAMTGLFALETAMDELAVALKMDPLTLRLRNYAETAPSDGKPYSTKALRECYMQAAERFGWYQRDPQPRSMRAGDEFIGWGMATGQWIAEQQEAKARVTLHADGRLEVETAASDLGTGTYTVLAQIAAATMNLRLEDVHVRISDSRLPQAPTAGGSTHVTSVGSAVEAACEKLRKKLKDGKIPGGAGSISASFHLKPDEDEQGKYVRASHSAVFCEVRVDDALGTVRVTRLVSAIAAGRIVNMLTARSQVLGGIVWGISHALHEETLIDHRIGRFMTHDLASYHVPVQADIHQLEVMFMEEDDRIVSRLGAKGLGEIGGLGVAAAISSAIHHATGRRVRSLPFTPDKVMAPV